MVVAEGVAGAPPNRGGGTALVPTRAGRTGEEEEGRGGSMRETRQPATAAGAGMVMVMVMW